MSDPLLRLSFDTSELVEDAKRIAAGELEPPTVSAVKIVASGEVIEERPIFIEELPIFVEDDE